MGTKKIKHPRVPQMDFTHTKKVQNTEGQKGRFN
jgi:hypothetical protein